MARFPRPVTNMTSVMPDATASSTRYWMIGLSTIGSISFGCALVAGKKRVPSPATGMMTFLIQFMQFVKFIKFLKWEGSANERCDGFRGNGEYVTRRIDRSDADNISVKIK